MKFVCKFIPCYLHYVDKVTSKSVRKQSASFAQVAIFCKISSSMVF